MTLPLLFLSAFLAQDVAPPPRPPANGPTIEATMKFIQEKLNEQGEVIYTLKRTGDDSDGAPRMKKLKKGVREQFLPEQQAREKSSPIGPRRRSEEVSDVVADPRTCQVSMRKTDGTYRFNFKEAEKLMVMPLKDALNKEAVDNGLPQDVEQVTPDISALLVQFKGRKLHHQMGRDMKDEFMLRLIFREDDMAQRMAKAMVHAIELCGGGNKDPF